MIIGVIDCFFFLILCKYAQGKLSYVETTDELAELLKYAFLLKDEPQFQGFWSL